MRSARRRPLKPIAGARSIGRTGAHLVTILGVLIATIASFMVLSDVIKGTTFDGTVYTWAVSATDLEVGFLIDPLTALMMVVVRSCR